VPAQPGRRATETDRTVSNIADGDGVFLEAFDWLDANARAPRADAKELSLVSM
jgi:hypothetical protein